MKWVDEQLSRLTHAQGDQAITLGSLVGVIAGLSVSVFQGLALELCLSFSFLSAVPGAVIMTAWFVVLSKSTQPRNQYRESHEAR